MSFFEHYIVLFSTIDADTHVITANQRTARFLSEQWDLWQQSRGAQAWPSLPCQSLQLWLENLWKQMLVAGLPEEELKKVMTPAQQRKIWSSIVAEQLDSGEILSTEGIVDAAMQAWQILRQWEKSLKDLPDDQQSETTLLKNCIRAYRDYCDETGFMDTVARTQLIEQLLLSSTEVNCRRVILVGFDNITPLHNAILDKLKRADVVVDYYDVTLKSQVRVCEPSDYLDEIQHAAHWAAEKIMECRKINKVYPRVGIVIPDLANHREDVETVFTQVFRPQNILPDNKRLAPVFNISAGQPLAQTPLIATAFAALNTLGKSVETGKLSRALLSPFLFGESDYGQRLKFVQTLLSEYDEISSESLRRRLQKTLARDDAEWSRRWLSFIDRYQQLYAKVCSFREWGDEFTQMLTDLGWPGPREIDTLEYQQLQHWPQLRDDLASLDEVVSTPPSWSDALGEFNRIAYIPFHPQTQSSPVQVLGLLEAGGLVFDYLWVLGLDNRAWPEPCKPNPLLPIALQKQWKMPRSSVERELELASLLTQRLASSAYEVIFSYPRTEGDQLLQISPLIASLPKSEPLKLSFDPVDRFCASQLQVLQDSKARELPAGHQTAGGTQIIKNQALCPFKAWANHRLRARTSETFSPGITPLLRGQLLHKVLEMVWTRLRTQEALIDMPSVEFVELLQESIDLAWNALAVPESIGHSVQSLEKQRARDLLMRWFDIEKQRPSFDVVSLEQTLHCDLVGLKMTARLDRRDHLKETGSHIVIDYKTGRTDIGKWFGDRPEEPQVPLYVLTDQEEIRAAAFAQINQHETAFKGICAEGELQGDLIGVEDLAKWQAPTAWMPLLAQWRSSLEGLAQAFLKGDARVDPKSAQAACTLCDLHNLCRIREALPTEESAEQDAQ